MVSIKQLNIADSYLKNTNRKNQRARLARAKKKEKPAKM